MEKHSFRKKILGFIFYFYFILFILFILFFFGGGGGVGRQITASFSCGIYHASKCLFV